MNRATTGTATLDLPDLSKGAYVVAVPVTEDEAIAVMPVQQLLSIVPDPIASEDPKRVASDPLLAQYWDIRREVQRLVSGAKLRNAESYKRYLIEGLEGRRDTMVPPITLFHPKRLDSTQLGSGVIALCIPFGGFMVAIDGETQRIAWQGAAREHPDALGRRVKVVIHHGKSIEQARQGFYDMNTLEVKPTAAVSISMDTQDIATRLARRIMNESSILKGRVNLHRRQLRASDPEAITISGLRTGIVTTVLGAPGLQAGTRPIASLLPEDVDLARLETAVVEAWCAVLNLLGNELDTKRRPHSVLSAPAVLAGVGIALNHAMPLPPRKREDQAHRKGMPLEAILDSLREVNWSRQAPEGGSPWDGIAGKVSATGFLSIGGPKEVGYRVAEALLDSSAESYRRVRAGNSAA